MGMITQQFGTARGLVRLALAHGEVLLGQAATKVPDPEQVKRLVFVCHGNICRSAVADVAARAAGMNVASFGLSTSSGKGAHPPAMAAAQAFGLDLSGHITTRVEDFVAEPGDLLLGMETRHMRKLAALSELGDVPRLLLGSFAKPSFPHLHDPYQLDPAYMPVCIERVLSAVEGLQASFPSARRPG